MTYTAPLDDIFAALDHVAGLPALIDSGLYPALDADLARAVLDEAGRLAANVIAPLNRVADKTGPVLADGAVTTPPGWKDAYTAWAEGGWNGLTAPEAFGGQDMPLLIQAACTEIWNAACAGFAIGPVLTAGAIEALTAHGSDDLKAQYLHKLVSGEWMGTMNLTEPQAGSDLAALRSKAVPVGDGSYKISGQKIYITYGEHDLTDNIIHLVLARLPDAPAGTKGISLFVVPKILPDGSRNDVICSGIEHKLGLHGSPTCTMIFGERDGAIGWLVGEENRGLNCMFTMMNNARLAVGLQGVAIAERAYQQALHYANERRQGKAASYDGEGMAPIIHHPDVARMLLTMRSLTQAARAICYQTAEALDRAHHETDPAAKEAAKLRAALLTPVAKAFSTDIGVEVASLGVQVHGGMGYIEETGAAQHLRDSRIFPIYEGTNGIQAIDLVTRKLPAQGGAFVRAYLADLHAAAASVGGDLAEAGARLAQAVGDLDSATEHLLAAGTSQNDALAVASPYLRLFGITAGGAALARIAVSGDNGAAGAAHRALFRFFADQVLTASGGLAATVRSGGASLALPADMLAA